MNLGNWLRSKTRPVDSADRDASPILAEARFVLVDVDVTGIDFRKDHATGLVALPFVAGRFRIADIAYCPLGAFKGDTADQQRPRSDQCRAVVDALASAIVVSYNPRFVRHMIRRGLAPFDPPLPWGPWLDLADILTGAIGSDMGEVMTMKRWQERLRVPVVSGHLAVMDVIAMAQLLAIALGYAEERGIMTLGGLMSARESHVWLRGE
jgi:hypothetical protein